MARRLAAILAADVVGYTRLMGADETGTLRHLTDLRQQILEPLVAEHHGRVVKLIGDGLLVDFASVVDALSCAVAWQDTVAEREAASEEEKRLQFRIGINLGDVLIEGDDIYGDGVNIAARLERLADPGGICLSGDAYRQAKGKVEVGFEDLGERDLKNVAESVRVYRVVMGECRPVSAGGAVADDQRRRTASTDEEHSSSPQGPSKEMLLQPEAGVHYVLTKDNVSIGYTSTGRGYPLLMAGSWLTHLVNDLKSPLNMHLIEALSRDFTLIRYDPRGSGMSDWDIEDFSFERLPEDLARVVDQLPYEKLAVLGASQGAAVAIAFATKFPHRVSHLILWGGYARGRCMRGNPDMVAESQALITLIRRGWASDNPAYRHTFTSLFMPDATPEEMQAFDDLQKISSTAENAARNREVFDHIDVSGILTKVQASTLVLHSRDDSMVPVSEGKFLASHIPNARFVLLNSRSHIVGVREPAWPKLLATIRQFVKGTGQP